ncbi:MAG: AmmeMemoRadiSam system protein B [Planctomycetes bacterium]|nr:AmmeMemoRadiSam system protein B [Planctomycetota bacterium]
MIAARPAAVAGSFYPGNAHQLLADIEGYMTIVAEKHSVLGVLSPHAGYRYSGRVAGELYSRITIPDTVVIIAPNHTGYGVPYSLWPGGPWQTPLGNVETNDEVVEELARSCDILEKDRDAHLCEHAAEVQIPFLQHFNPYVKIVVMVVSSQNISDLRYIGTCLSRVLQRVSPQALVVASSDMTHYESQADASKKDKIAINEILSLNEDGLYNKVNALGITMCGICPAFIMLVCSKARGAKKAELVRYETSGNITGDYNSVVGYAGIMVR